MTFEAFPRRLALILVLCRHSELLAKLSEDSVWACTVCDRACLCVCVGGACTVSDPVSVSVRMRECFIKDIKALAQVNN